MPSMRMSEAVAKKPGVRRKPRRAKRTSWRRITMPTALRRSPEAMMRDKHAQECDASRGRRRVRAAPRPPIQSVPRPALGDATRRSMDLSTKGGVGVTRARRGIVVARRSSRAQSSLMPISEFFSLVRSRSRAIRAPRSCRAKPGGWRGRTPGAPLVEESVAAQLTLPSRATSTTRPAAPNPISVASDRVRRCTEPMIGLMIGGLG